MRISGRPLSRSFLPQAFPFCLLLTSFFLVSKPFNIHWEENFLSVHATFEKNFQCWQVFYLSGNEIRTFFQKIFIFRYHWQVKYLSAIERLNRALRFYLVFDMCFTCQCMKFLDFIVTVTSILLVNQCFFDWLTSKKLVSVVFRYTEKKKACQLDSMVTVTSFLLVSG